MAFKHGSAAVLTINSGAMTGYTNDTTLDRSTDTAETTVLGVTSKTYIPGLNDGTFSGSGFYDPTASTGPVAIMEAVYAGAAAVTCVYKPGGTASGQYSYTFSAILTQWTIAASLDGAVPVSWSMQITGAVTPAVL